MSTQEAMMLAQENALPPAPEAEAAAPPAPAPPAPVPGALQEMSLDDIKTKLYTRMQDKGKFGVLKAGVRKMLFSDLSQTGGISQRTPKCSLAQLALNTIFLEYLQTSQYHFTHSVFVSECNLGNTPETNKLTLEDAHLVLSNSDTTHEALHPLLKAMQKIRQADMTSVSSQCGEQDVLRLDHKLQMIDEEFSTLRLAKAANGPSVEQRIRTYQEDIDREAEKRVKEEVDAWRQRELTRMRLEEASAYETKLRDRLLEVAEKERQVSHDLQMEKYALQSRSREMEYQSAQLEKERADFSLVLASREANFSSVQQEVLQKDETIHKLESELHALVAELKATRDVSRELQANQKTYNDEIHRVQRENQRETERRSLEWTRYQEEKNNILAEYQHKILENDLVLQNKVEEVRREFDAREVRTKHEYALELKRAKEGLGATEESMRKEVEKEVRAALSSDIAELQRRQTEFCKAMVEAQMEFEAKRGKIRKMQFSSDDHTPPSIPLSTRRRSAKRKPDSRVAADVRKRQQQELQRQLLFAEVGAGSPDEATDDSLPTVDMLRVAREQSMRNYKLMSQPDSPTSASVASAEVRHMDAVGQSTLPQDNGRYVPTQMRMREVGHNEQQQQQQQYHHQQQQQQQQQQQYLQQQHAQQQYQQQQEQQHHAQQQYQQQEHVQQMQQQYPKVDAPQHPQTAPTVQPVPTVHFTPFPAAAPAEEHHRAAERAVRAPTPPLVDTVPTPAPAAPPAATSHKSTPPSPQTLPTTIPPLRVERIVPEAVPAQPTATPTPQPRTPTAADLLALEATVLGEVAPHEAAARTALVETFRVEWGDVAAVGDAMLGVVAVEEGVARDGVHGEVVGELVPLLCEAEGLGRKVIDGGADADYTTLEAAQAESKSTWNSRHLEMHRRTQEIREKREAAEAAEAARAQDIATEEEDGFDSYTTSSSNGGDNIFGSF